MAQDDLVPDAALVTRMHNMHRALAEVLELVTLRSHLRETVHGPLTDSLASLHLAAGLAEGVAQPDDPINAKYRSRMRDEYCITATGGRFYAYDPKPEEVKHEDIVTGLVKEGRYGNQIPGLRIYSVAEHSIKVAAMVEHLCTREVERDNLPEDIIPLATLYGMLHDAHEALTGGDVPGPYKARLADVFGTPWSLIEDRVQACVVEAYALPPCPVEVDALVKQADGWMVYAEALTFWPDKLDEFPKLKRMVPPPGDVLAVGRVKAEEPDRATVRDIFDSEIRRLVSLVGGRIPGDRVDERRVSRAQAAAEFAQAAKQAGVPGERENPPPPKPMPERTPVLSRPPRDDDVSPGSWQQAVRSSSVEEPPPGALSRLLNDPDLTPEERERLEEMGGGA